MGAPESISSAQPDGGLLQYHRLPARIHAALLWRRGRGRACRGQYGRAPPRTTSRAAATAATASRSSRSRTSPIWPAPLCATWPRDPCALASRSSPTCSTAATPSAFARCIWTRTAATVSCRANRSGASRTSSASCAAAVIWQPRRAVPGRGAGPRAAEVEDVRLPLPLSVARPSARPRPRPPCGGFAARGGRAGSAPARG